MQKYIGLILFALFVLESSLVPLILPEAWIFRVSPRLVLVFILYIAIFSHRRHMALVWGLVFGFLYDLLHLVYLMGLYTFLFGLSGYLTGLSPRRASFSLFSALGIIAVGLLFFETSLYLFYSLFQKVSASYGEVMLRTILPSWMFNMGFALVIYWPGRLLLEPLADPSDNEEHA